MTTSVLRVGPEMRRVAGDLMGGVLARYGITEGGVVVGSVGAWSFDGSVLEIPRATGLALRVAHDDVGAPFALGPNNLEDRGLLVSCADEDGVSVCAWMRLEGGESVVGLGVDLASADDFEAGYEDEANRLMLSSRELQVVKGLFPDRGDIGLAYAMAAKEAAFKACSQRYRAYCQNVSAALEYDVTEFELVASDRVCGTLNRARAQEAMPLIGVDGISLYCALLDGAVLAIAAAIAK